MKRLTETMPEKIEREIYAEYPHLDAGIDKILGMVETAGEKIPEWCAVPMGVCGAYNAVAKANGSLIGAANILRFGEPYEKAAATDKMTATLGWRRGKVIYRFDDSLTAELKPSRTDAFKPPADVIRHAPYPCVYIEGLPGTEGVNGAYFLLDYDVEHTKDLQLYIVYCFDNGDIFSDYRQWGEIEEKINLENGRWFVVEDEYRDRLEKDAAYKETAVRCLNNELWHLNMFLYLCSEKPDITRETPIPRVRGNGRNKTAARVDPVYVGRYIGATLRKAAEAEERAVTDGTGRSVRPHMRRAHWSLFWTGKGRKTPILKWISQIFVNGDGNEVPMSVHAVAKT